MTSPLSISGMDRRQDKASFIIETALCASHREPAEGACASTFLHMKGREVEHLRQVPAEAATSHAAGAATAAAGRASCASA
jgi:hypothetical protein